MDDKKIDDMIEEQNQDDPYLDELDSSLEDLLEDEPTPQPHDETADTAIDDSEDDVEDEDFEDEDYEEDEIAEDESAETTASFFEPPAPPRQAAATSAPPLPRMTSTPRTSNLPLEIRIVIAEHTMSLAELLAVQPGALIDLKRAPHPTVDLMIQNKCIARGELVIIDGRLGVRVLSIMEEG